MLRLGFLASHNGSNMQAVVHACRDGSLAADPAVVISNNRDSGTLRFARDNALSHYCLNTRTHPLATQLDQAILHVLQTHQVDLVLLLGYMKLLGPSTIAAYRGRILNIHPALLPKYGGQGMYGVHVHQAVLAADEKETGVTIHLADEQYDHGGIIAQSVVPVCLDDSPQSLAARVLKEEHRFLVVTLQRIADGDLILPGLEPVSV